MIVLGITGGSGCGKTTLLHCVSARGGLAIDCDAVYHELLRTDAALLDALARRFPGTVERGALNRKKLGKLVFDDPAALSDLEALTHPRVVDAVGKLLAGAKDAPLAALDAVALVESGLDALCDVTVAVTAPVEDRVRRIMCREGVSEDYARLRISAQKSDAAFCARCDRTLYNDFPTAAAFAARCEALIHQILEDCTMPEMDWDAMRGLLTHETKSGYDFITEADRAAMEDYCREYMRFIGAAKTEREVVAEVTAAARDAGFRPFDPEAALNPGDRVYYINRNKCIALAVIGREPMDAGMRIATAHIDSPRLDLKPRPLYEEQELALLKTHYYGGIKNYQWTTVPLALHGVVAMADGRVLKVTVGEDPADPVFCIADLLIHLAKEQMKKTLAEGVPAEKLNVLLGSRPAPLEAGEKDRVKLAVLMLLHEKYGITEADFLSAELCLVPALPVREVGIDRSMIGAYGHDDRVCAYACVAPLLAMEGAPEHTCFCLLADKEEIGSEGVTGMQSEAFEYLMEEFCARDGSSLRRCFANSVCLSADVTAALDPNYAEVHDKYNCDRLNHGVSICKYTGSRGKSDTSDASAELVARFRHTFQENDVVWQMGELGKVDIGGGGTIAIYMAKRNIDTLDAGVPVLSMHAPWEIVGKFDCYMTMKAYRAFYHMP